MYTLSCSIDHTIVTVHQAVIMIDTHIRSIILMIIIVVTTTEITMEEIQVEEGIEIIEVFF